jgi:hypothetical protein
MTFRAQILKEIPLGRQLTDSEGQTMILSSGNNLNTGNTFVDLMEKLVQSNFDNNYAA